MNDLRNPTTGGVILNQTVTTDGNYVFTFPADSTSYQFRFADASTSGANRDPYIINASFVAPIPCFTAGTMITTPKGQRDVATLQVDDLVETCDNGSQAIRWIGQKTVLFTSTPSSQKLMPIRISAGALGQNMPEADLVVSPQHRILLKNKIAVRMFETDEVLTAAKNLLELPGVTIDEDVTSVTYIHILLDDHDLVLSNGTWTETLYFGKQALAGMTDPQLEEIKILFPEILSDDFIAPTARQFVNGAPTRKLVARAQENFRSLVEF